MATQRKKAGRKGSTSSLESLAKNKTLMFWGGTAVAVFLAFRMTSYINTQLTSNAMRRVQSVSVVSSDQRRFDAQRLYPVIVENKVAKAPVNPEGILLDELFKGKKVVVAAPVIDDAGATILPDFRDLIADIAVVQGTIPGGAFINGQFFKRGDMLQPLAAYNGESAVVPMLEEVRGQKVTIVWIEGKGKNAKPVRMDLQMGVQERRPPPAEPKMQKAASKQPPPGAQQQRRRAPAEDDES